MNTIATGPVPRWVIVLAGIAGVIGCTGVLIGTGATEGSQDVNRFVVGSVAGVAVFAFAIVLPFVLFRAMRWTTGVGVALAMVATAFFAGVVMGGIAVLSFSFVPMGRGPSGPRFIADLPAAIVAFISAAAAFAALNVPLSPYRPIWRGALATAAICAVSFSPWSRAWRRSSLTRRWRSFC